MNRHRAKCDILKKIRKGIADRLGIDLHQRECTFEGECKGTCPKCKQEEDILNRELARRAGALALGATASLMLTACVPADTSSSSTLVPEFDGGLTYEDELTDDGIAIMGEPDWSAPDIAEDGVPDEGPEYEAADDPEEDSVPVPETTAGVSP